MKFRAFKNVKSHQWIWKIFECEDLLFVQNNKEVVLSGVSFERGKTRSPSIGAAGTVKAP